MTTNFEDGLVEFGIYRPGAHYVSVAGDFNQWDPQRTPMRREPNGHWKCEVQLHPGSYQFKYFVDGTWVLDCASFGLQPGPFGWNSVIYVRPPRAA